MPKQSTMSAEDQVKYLLLVLKHCELPKPNFKDVAAEANINNANNAQKKFKSIVESGGTYKLVNNQIVDCESDEE